MLDKDRFIADCRAALNGADSVRNVREVVARTVADPAAVTATLGEPKGGGIVPIYRSPELTIINVLWPVNMVIMPHNHNTWAVIGVYGGREDNILWRRLPADSSRGIEAAGAKSLCTKDAIAFGPDLIHSVVNPSAKVTGAIHVQGTDFFAIPRSEWDPDSLQEQPYDQEKARRMFARQPMGKTIDFYWDLGSTNSYFALHLIKPVAAKHGATVVPHPFNLGYVFRQHNYVLMDEPKAKIANRFIDLHRWARRYKLPFRMPTKFPIKTSPALRGALAARRFGKEWDYLEAIFAAYWERDDASVAELGGLRPVAKALGVNADRFLALAESAEVRRELIAETDAGLARGVFGAPTFVVGEEIFWGKDRMDFIDEELARQA